MSSLQTFTARTHTVTVGSSSAEPPSFEETWIPFMVSSITEEDERKLQANGAAMQDCRHESEGDKY